MTEFFCFDHFFLKLIIEDLNGKNWRKTSLIKMINNIKTKNIASNYPIELKFFMCIVIIYLYIFHEKKFS